ncbi:MAG: hypothetical protein AB1Z23_10290 [Eubacteriales bacterium]
MKKFLNKNKKVYAAVLIIISVALSSCFTPPTPESTESYMSPEPTQTLDTVEKSISMALVTEDYVMESWPIMTELYKLSGIKAYYKTIRPDDWQDAIGRIMASEEEYDFVEMDSYTAEFYKERLFDISPYLEEHAPNYLQWANTNVTFASNYAYGQPITYFPIREDENILKGCVFADPSIRNKSSLNLEEFISFMDGKQIALKGSTREMVDFFAPYFGTNTYWYYTENQLVYGPTSDEFKEMLRTLNDFYKLGIIPSDYQYSPPTEFTNAVLDRTAGIAMGKEEDFEWLYENGYRPIMLQFSENAYLPSYADEPSKMGGIIAGTGKEIDVLKFIDACFSKEGRALLNYGVDGMHTLAHSDGSIEYLLPYAHSGEYQWENQGLTPEGLPGIYYNSWAKYSEELLAELIPLRQYLPDNSLISPAESIAYTSYQPKRIIKESVENLQYTWWNDFITGKKSVDWDWGDYLYALNNAGANQGYLESTFN